jgi:two-component system, cell cycle sensor histidine kinase and response regulator CckA
MRRTGWFYVGAVTVTAAAATASLLPRLALQPWEPLLVFGLLAAGAAVGSILIVSTEPNHGFNTALVFIAAAAVLLPPELVALMGIAHICPAIGHRASPWYVQVFNAANYTLNGLAAWAALQIVTRALVEAPTDLRYALGVVAACIALVATNHLLLAVALRVGRARSFLESGLFSAKSLFTDLALASLGATLAIVSAGNIYLAPLVLGPFVLVSRSFSLLELLRRSEGRFRAIYESTAMGIRLTDTSGRIDHANSAFVQMVGVDADAVIGKMVTELVHEDDAGAHRDLFRQLVQGEHDSHALEQRYRRPDGTLGWAHVTESLVRDADGAPSLTVGTVHDVTERKQLEERLNQTQKMEAVGRLAGGVAHDFNNLLTVINTHSAFVLSSLDAGEPVGRSDVAAIAQAAGKAGALTSQLLAFGSRQMRQPRILDLNAVVLETHKLLEHTIGKDISIGLDLQASLAPVRADETQLEQVLVNLAINAADAMPDGGELTIRTAMVAPPQNVDAEENARYVLLAVADTGCGMDAATRTRIFEPFFTTKQTKGTGLGLASTYGIVAQTGGALEVESKVGAGTTMSIFLPAADKEALVVASPPARRRHNGKSPTILLVDDEDLVRAAARRVLAATGYVVLEAFDAADALDVVRRHDGPIDLLLTDLVMPRMDGRALATLLLADRPDLPVVYTSGYSDHAIRSLPADSPEDVQFVHKPFTEDALLAAVGTALGSEPTAIERSPVGARARG